MLSRVRHLLIGSPLPTQAVGYEKLNKIRALAAFSPDALSSIAYANQEIYLGLVVAGSIGLRMAWPIGLAITIVLGLVALSYYQTIHAYPSGGGSYIVSKENLGVISGLIAGASLLIDYLLTAAVSLTAGVEAIASALPGLWSYRIEVALLLLIIITLINLRGARETGTFMAFPVNLFVVTYLSMLAYGGVRFLLGNYSISEFVSQTPVQPLSLFLLLHTFSSGCTALTGIEAISNGVPAFKSPEARNAGRTLIVMALLMGMLFLGSIGLTQVFGIVSAPNETILSALSRNLLGSSPWYYLIQSSTLLILTVAANTSFTGFPRLTAILAKDGFLPRQFTGLGDRLVFVNGIVALSVATGILMLLFGGDSHRLIPLFAVGAFIAYTFSQSGMMVHWWRFRGKNWLFKLLFNGIGAIVTATTFLVIGISKFVEGAWITLTLISLFVLIFNRIHDHYQTIQKQLSLRGLPPSLKPFPKPRIVIPISGVHRGIIDSVAFAQAVTDEITAIYIELEPGEGENVHRRWKRLWPDIPLHIVPSPYREILRPLIDYIDYLDAQANDGQQAIIVLPEFVPAKWWHSLLHNQTAWMIKAALLYRRRHFGFQRVIIDIPYHLKR